MSYTSNANLLTYSRIIVIPIIAIFYYLPFDWAKVLSCVIFAYAGLTDFLDGYLARKYNMGTLIGKFLDPVADKLLVIICLVILVTENNEWYILIPSLVIIAREIIVTALREFMALLKLSDIVEVSAIGKWKTAAQMIAIGCLLFQIWDWVFYVGIVCLIVAAVLTVWSLIDYLIVALIAVDKQIAASKEQNNNQS